MATDNIHIEKLGSNNYSDWRASMVFLLKAKKLWSAVDPATADDRETRASSKDASDRVRSASSESRGVSASIQCQYQAVLLL